MAVTKVISVDILLESTYLGVAKVFVPDIFKDQRGFFSEVYRSDQMSDFGVSESFVQFNLSGSVKNVVRGLHFQYSPPMSKLMRVAQGTAYLVAVDIRKGSPTLGQWIGIEASAENRRMLWTPASFARGFCVLSEFAEIQYFCSGIYNKAGESGIRWNDPQIGVEWPITTPILSEKDSTAQTLSEWLETPESDYFKYEE